MQIDKVSRKRSIFAQDFLEAYLEGKLSSRYHFSCDWSGVKEASKNRQDFSLASRQRLVAVMKKQYEQSAIDIKGSLVEDRIHSLEKATTLTVTTGQQIHIGLGPLYVLYKALNVLRLAEEFNEKFTDYTYVPVFWMATEDHDLEEIRDIRLFGKDFPWETEQKGAVGRMDTAGIADLLDQISSELRLNVDQEQFVAVLRKAYALPCLADASRLLLHQVFGKAGLVVLDADQVDLKLQMESSMLNELKGLHYELLEKGTQELKNQGFDPQIHIRPINLFYLAKGDRIRIEHKEGNFEAAGEVLTAEENISDWLKDNALDLSPNVALRPLYQETILPNVLYVGGPSEVRYWLQLKELFDYEGLKLPVLYPRTSCILLEARDSKLVNEHELADFHLSEEQLMRQHTADIEELRSRFKDELDKISASLASWSKDFSQSFKGANVDGKVNKLYPKLQELASISDKKALELAENDPVFNRLLKVKRKSFNAANPQERRAHAVEFAQFIPLMLENQEVFGMDNLLKINHLLTN